MANELQRTESDPRVERARILRRLTPGQRRYLRELPKDGWRMYVTAKRLGMSEGTVHKWRRDPDFVRAKELVEQDSIDAIGINAAYVLESTREVVERCMQAEPVLDHEGNATGEWQFNSSGALKGLEMLGRHRRLWSDERAASAAPIGPGLTVVVQNAVTVAPTDGPQTTRVDVQLPGPE